MAQSGAPPGSILCGLAAICGGSPLSIGAPRWLRIFRLRRVRSKAYRGYVRIEGRAPMAGDFTCSDDKSLDAIIREAAEAHCLAIMAILSFCNHNLVEL
jgi:hypothetical protein